MTPKRARNVSKSHQVFLGLILRHPQTFRVASSQFASKNFSKSNKPHKKRSEIAISTFNSRFFKNPISRAPPARTFFFFVKVSGGRFKKTAYPRPGPRALAPAAPPPGAFGRGRPFFSSVAPSNFFQKKEGALKLFLR